MISTHGIATLNEEIVDAEGNPVIKVGEQGVITTYLPEDDTFAVMFTEDRWITFQETEEEFNKRFKVEKTDEESDSDISNDS